MLRPLTIGLVALSLLTANCGNDADHAESDEAREAAVYAAIIRDVADSLIPKGEEPSERTAFVQPLDPDAEIGLEVQAGAVRRLEDVVDVSFIDDREAAVDEEEDGESVREGSALIAVGPVPRGRDLVVVEVARYLRQGNEETLLYVVERGPGGWNVSERRPVG